MPRTIPCPHGDGMCTIPDPAVVAIGGHLSLMASSALERVFPDLENAPESAVMRLPRQYSYSELVGHVSQYLSERDDSEGGGTGTAVQSQSEAVVASILAAVSGDGVIANCDCPHNPQVFR